MEIDLDIANNLEGDELIEYFKKTPMRKYDKLSMSYVSVRQLVDFIGVLDKNEKDYQDIFNKSVLSMKDKNVKPSKILNFYIIIEIVSFYENLKNIIKNYPQLPPIPPYFKILKESRGRVLAHKDKTNSLEDSGKWMNQYAKIDKIGIPKIIQDFYTIYDVCKNVLGDDI